jgi:hypothetical protein
VKTIGHIAYEAFCKALNGPVADAEEHLPIWEGLGARIREAWELAASAAIENAAGR